MSVPELSDPPWDEGLQNERTRLAWLRTTLSGLTCCLLVARMLAPRFLVLAIAVGLAAVLSSAVLGWLTTRRYAENHLALHQGRLTAGARSQLVVTALVLITAVAALAYLTFS